MERSISYEKTNRTSWAISIHYESHADFYRRMRKDSDYEGCRGRTAGAEGIGDWRSEVNAGGPESRTCGQSHDGRKQSRGEGHGSSRQTGNLCCQEGRLSVDNSREEEYLQ